MRQLLAGLSYRPAATDEMVANCERQLAAKLPVDYVEFLKIANGGEGFVGNGVYVMLWSVEELAPMNQSYEVQRYAPGLLIFGSDGGGESYGFDVRDPQWPIVQIPFVGMSWKLARSIGASFTDFLRRLNESE